MLLIDEAPAGPHQPIVLADTTGMTYDEWAAVRESLHGLGGSDAGAAVGVNPWKAPIEVWGEKTGLHPSLFEDTESTFWGRELEDPVAAVFARRHPDLTVWRDQRIYAHPQLEFLFANLDRRIGFEGILEVKTADKDMADHWEDGPPIYYQLQVQHYLAVMGLAWAWVVVLLGGNRYREYLLERDDLLITGLLRLEQRFWIENVLGDVPPAIIGTDSEADWIRGAHPARRGEEIVLPPEVVDMVDDLVAVKASIAQLDKQRKALENAIKYTMGGATEGIDPVTGHTKVTWREHDESRVDVDRFRSQSPYLFSTYTKTNQVRTLRTPPPPKPKKAKKGTM